MNHLSKLVLVLLAGFFMGCSHDKEEENSHQLHGLWSLHIMEKQDSATGQWHEWRDGMQGYILYDSKDNMSLHLTTKGYEKTNLKFPNFNDSIPLEALQHLTNSYVYFAKYSIDEDQQIVQHARISHSNPAEWNDVVRRRYSFIGDTLVLEPTEKKTAGLRLKWLRYSAEN